MRTLQALGVMALWTISIFAVINFFGLNELYRSPWAIVTALLFVIMLVGNFWIFFAIAKEEPWEWDKSKESE